MKKLFVATTALLMSAGTAWAQDSDGDGIDDEFDPDTTTTPPVAEPTTTTTDDAPAGDGTAPQWGIEVSWNGVGAIPAAHLLYGISETAFIDGRLQFDFQNISPEMGDSTTVIDLGIGVGYRMYQDMKGRVHPYLEPFLDLLVSTNEATGEPKVFALGALFGVDVQVFDQFTLGAAVGAALAYETTTAATGDESTFSFGLFTTSLNATIWW